MANILGHVIPTISAGSCAGARPAARDVTTTDNGSRSRGYVGKENSYTLTRPTMLTEIRITAVTRVF